MKCIHTVKFESEDKDSIEMIEHVLRENIERRFFDSVTVIRGTENR